MKHEIIKVQISDKMLSQATQLAQRDDVSIGHLVRNLLSREIARQLNAKPTNQADGRLVAALEALLARHMALAEGWPELALRLADEGYELRPAGGGVNMHKRPCGTRLCKASELGFPYRALVKRFRRAMPGHPHGTLDLVFDRLPARHSTMPLEEDDEFEVIDFNA